MENAIEFAPAYQTPAEPSSDAREIAALAAQIRRHKFPIFGQILDTGAEIRWRRDYTRGIETSLQYFRAIPSLDAERAGDHKFIWELNRHQHLVVLAQSWLLDRDDQNLREIQAQIESWLAQNPFQRGINWASALEVAFRAMSWIEVEKLAGSRFPAGFRRKWHNALYQHGCHIENNLSIYFSPNTHLLGEALALSQLARFFRGSERAAHWKSHSAALLGEQMDRQVRADGSHFEQSSYYHVYALDMFLKYAADVPPDAAYLAKLERMCDFLDALLGPARSLPFLGDDDGGRLSHPYGPRDRFASATLAAAGREHPGEGKRESRFFPDAGIAVMVCGENQVIVDAGGFGPWGAGHSHADTLSIVARSGPDEILIDPGTYTYVGDAHWRGWFRGTAAHNTVRIDGLNQAAGAGPFRWLHHPEVKVLEWTSSAAADVLEAECRYQGFVHRRRAEFQKPGLVLIEDQIDGPPGEHLVEQFWHLGSPGARDRLDLEPGVELIESWRSVVFGEKRPSLCARVSRRGRLPIRLQARMRLGT